MKRRVASLPPVSATIFNQKVQERQLVTPLMEEISCDICHKTYASVNAYQSHVNSKRHKDNEIKAASKPSIKTDRRPKLSTHLPSLALAEDATEEDINRAIDEKITAARTLLKPTSCLFCTTESSTLEQSLEHMASTHSFFIPDVEYLVDLPGLIAYLSDKIAVGNACLYCSTRGKEFRSLEAVRQHMVDKSHCKMAYDLEGHRLEYSDFYDFTSSYPDATQMDEGWEDVENDSDTEVDEVIELQENDIPENQVTYGDTTYELVLPSGARIGHRSMRQYYAQSFSSNAFKSRDSNSAAALVRKLLKDKNSALVSRKGGFGAFGKGTEVVKARNRGEAREAGRHIREFRDQKRREDFRTKVAFIHNHQKHFRDPLLQ